MLQLNYILAYNQKYSTLVSHRTLYTEIQLWICIPNAWHSNVRARNHESSMQYENE